MTGTQGHPWTRYLLSPHTRAPVEKVSGKDGPNPSLRPCQLRHWLNTLRDRNVTASVTTHGIQLAGPADDNDHNQAARHRHALHVAAAGTHPDWWNTVLGNTPAHPDLTIPPSATDPDSWACTTCGAPSPWLDADLLPWCDLHVQEDQL